MDPATPSSSSHETPYERSQVELNEEEKRLASSLEPEFLDELFKAEFAPEGSKRMAIAMMRSSTSRCDPKVLEAYANQLLDDGDQEEAEEVLSLLCQWNSPLSNDDLVDRICAPEYSMPRDEFLFSKATIPLLQEQVLLGDERQKIWAGKALARTIEHLRPQKTLKEWQKLLEALPGMLTKLPLRGVSLAILTALAKSFDVLVEHDLGIALILSGLRYALVEIQMNLESVTCEREKDMFAFMSGCFFAEAVITQLDEATKIPFEKIGEILTAIHRIMVVAFDFWLDENPESVPIEVAVPLTRLISAWTNGDPEKFSTEFNAIVPKLLQVAPAEMMPALAAVQTRDNGPSWLTKDSLRPFLEYLVNDDGSSLPRQVGCRIAAEIAMDPYVDFHDIIPSRDRRLYDKRGLAPAEIPRPVTCQILSCPTCYTINAWAHALETRETEDCELRRAYCIAAYCFKVNCGNLLELPELDWTGTPKRIKNEAGFLFRAAVRAACMANQAASFTIPRTDEEWLEGDMKAAKIVLGRTMASDVVDSTLDTTVPDDSESDYFDELD